MSKPGFWNGFAVKRPRNWRKNKVENLTGVQGVVPRRIGTIVLKSPD